MVTNMNEEIKQDEIIEVEVKPEEVVQEEVVVVAKFSFAKILMWVSVPLAVIIPFISLGASITALILATPEDKDEIYIVCPIAIAVAAFLTIMSVIG